MHVGVLGAGVTGITPDPACMSARIVLCGQAVGYMMD